MSENKVYTRPYRSLFWPVLLIGIGVIWLLSNLKLIPTENLWILLRLWPVLIIVAGLDVLFARRFVLIGALLGLLMIAGVVYILLSGEGLGVEPAPQPRTESFSVQMDNTTRAEFQVELSIQNASIRALDGSDQLVVAEIGHLGDIVFTVTGAEEKTINLRQTGIGPWFGWLIPTIDKEDLVWEIGLSPDVPFDLMVDASTGKSELDLSGIQLDEFQFDASTGASTIILPESTVGYETRIDASTGSLEVVLPAESNLTVYLDGSTGRVVFDVPKSAEIRIEVLSGGTGDLRTPSWISKVSGAENRDEGVYQSEGFDSAAYQLVIIIEDISTGNIVFQ